MAEIDRPKKEVRGMKSANEILRRALSFFGAELDRQHRLSLTSSTATRTGLSGVIVVVGGCRLKVGVPAGIFDAGANARQGRPPRSETTVKSGAIRVGHVSTPMQATVIAVRVRVADFVVRGHILCVLEAIKMEQPILALSRGGVSLLKVQVGESVSGGHLLASLS